MAHSSLVILKRGKARPFYGRHPWVFEGAIAAVEGAEDGAEVDLLSEERRFIARGIYNGQSKLRVRLYSWNEREELDENFFRTRLVHALFARDTLGYNDPRGAARLVNSEADGLSGLTVDRFADHLVVQIGALAMQRRFEMLRDLLIELCRPKSITLRSEKGISALEGMAPSQGLIWGELAGPIDIEEHGLRYRVDLLTGQKTGFYLDQRENRRAVAGYLRGLRVLDLYCYSGGFALTAARLGGAASVLGIDSSEPAIELARANAAQNAIEHVEFQARDCPAALDQLAADKVRFDAIILDPPKFARTRANVPQALRAYERINRRAVELLTPGGILVTCSCSGSITQEDFRQLLAGVAEKSGRDIQLYEQRGAAPDHPVSVRCFDSEYLKCFVCRVG